MKIIEIHNQPEFDALPKSFTEHTYINISGSVEVNRDYNNSTVTACDNSTVNNYSSCSVLFAFMLSVVIMRVKNKVKKAHKTATVINKWVKAEITNKMFCETLEKVKAGDILYKSVNPDTFCDFRTGKIKYEGAVTCPDWDSNPERECGGGLHLSPTKEMALGYNVGKVLKCVVRPQDFVVYQAGDFTKVRCKRVTVIGEV